MALAERRLRRLLQRQASRCVGVLGGCRTCVACGTPTRCLHCTGCCSRSHGGEDTGSAGMPVRCRPPRQLLRCRLQGRRAQRLFSRAECHTQACRRRQAAETRSFTVSRTAAFACYMRSTTPDIGTDCAQAFLQLQVRWGVPCCCASALNTGPCSVQACINGHPDEFAALRQDMALQQ
jgi:hypothetical protein